MLAQPKAEAKKADRVNWVALLMPRPPDPIGMEACVYLRAYYTYTCVHSNIRNYEYFRILSYVIKLPC